MKNGIKMDSLESKHILEVWTTDGSIRGDLHRIDGPAVMYADGAYHWMIYGDICKSFKEFQTRSNISDEDLLALQLKYPFIPLLI